jgi:hypothetical protein
MAFISGATPGRVKSFAGQILFPTNINFRHYFICLFFEQYQKNEINLPFNYCFITYRSVFVEPSKQLLMRYVK